MLRAGALRIAAAAALFALAGGISKPAAAQTAGDACPINGSTAAATVNEGGDNLVCVSGTWTYVDYTFQSAAASAGSSCSGTPAGTVRYNKP